MATTHDVSFLFIELGLAIVGLAVLARLAKRWGFSAIPLYLLAGLAGRLYLHSVFWRDWEGANRTPANGESRDAISPLGAGTGGFGNGCLPAAGRCTASWGRDSDNCAVGLDCDCGGLWCALWAVR